MKIYSWNINGLRAVLKKGALETFIKEEQPDILCLQEIKAKPDQVTPDFPEYEEFWNSAKRPGYSGTAIFSKVPPLNTANNLPEKITADSFLPEDQYGNPNDEGRVQTAEFEKFFLVNVYTPNAKADLSRLSLRERYWDPLFLKYLKKLEETKPIIVCGDFNAAHTEIDLARPKQNTKNAGFTPAERQGISNLIDADLIDTFRVQHPTEQRYTWWSHYAKSRERNVGWRIDYFFASKCLNPFIRQAEIHENFFGSDHCPISIEILFNQQGK